MARVTLKSVTKRFGDVVAVDALSLDVADREFMVLVGPSGCGKTTALRLIAGLEELSAGDILIADRLVNAVPAKDRDIAMVFQSYALYPHMSVYDNMAFGLRLRMLGSLWRQWTHPSEARRRRAEIDARVKSTAELLGLQGLMRRRPKELSGGQRQRVALGRAIVREPKVFLMDEPLSNLDAKLRVQTRAELIRLHRRLRITTVYVTHDQTEAMTMGDRIAVIKDGLLQQLATPEELYHRPANSFVASFIGSPPMNLLEAPVREGAAPLGEAKFPLPSAAKGMQTVLLGVRPEAFRPAPPGVELRPTVDVIEPLGATKTLTMNLAGYPLVATVSADVPTSETESLSLWVRPESLHFFDPSNGDAIR